MHMSKHGMCLREVTRYISQKQNKTHILCKNKANFSDGTIQP